MRRKRFLVLSMVLLITSLLLTNLTAYACHDVDPIVSTQWLAANKYKKDLVIIDVRSAAEYAAGHIENSINVPFEVPFSAWITMRDDLLLELPDQAELFDTIGSFGITRNSTVVIVGTTAPPNEPPYPLADATRAAVTLIYAGVENVAILNGGYPKWVAENRPVTTKVPVVKPVTFRGKIDKKMIVSAYYVNKRIGKSFIIDGRDAEVYYGQVIEPWADKPGHIPSAKSLPAPLMWNSDGTYKHPSVIKGIVSSIVHKENKEIIVYCGVGGYGSALWFVLTQVLGYKDVRFFDGSAQEWVRYYDMILY